MSVGERIRERLEGAGLSQAELARRVGLTQPTINGLIRGTSRSSAHLHKIARELQTTPEFLSGETDDPSPQGVADRQVPFHGAPSEDHDTVEVASIDFAYGMGGTYLDSDSPDVETHRFSLGFLRGFTDAPPSQLFVARGVGDSMMPTIHDRDVVLVDRSERQLRMRDQIWAVSIGGVGMIKRLRPQTDGTVIILSDNASVPEDRATSDELFLIGRVVAIVRRV